MFIDEYFSELRTLTTLYHFIVSMEIEEDCRTDHSGFIKMRAYLIDNSVLSFREFVNTSGANIQKYMYSYHYFKETRLIFRYDNTPHFPHLPSYPHHKHNRDGSVISCNEPTLQMVLDEIEDIISKNI